MTLGGFVLAVGILVDDATVEVEKINRNRAAEPDKDMDELVLDSAMQIATPGVRFYPLNLQVWLSHRCRKWSAHEQ